MQKKGSQLKIYLREIQTLMSRLKKSYSHEVTSVLKDRCLEAQSALKELEEITPGSRGEQYEKEQLVKAYTQQFQKILDGVHTIQEQPEKPQEPQTLQAQVFEEDFFRERHQEINQVETVLVEINDMMKFCAESVTEQGQTLDTIENHVEISEESTRRGVEELTKAEKSQNSSRNMSSFLLLIAFILVLILVLIMITHIN